MAVEWMAGHPPIARVLTNENLPARKAFERRLRMFEMFGSVTLHYLTISPHLLLPASISQHCVSID